MKFVDCKVDPERGGLHKFSPVDHLLCELVTLEGTIKLASCFSASEWMQPKIRIEATQTRRFLLGDLLGFPLLFMKCLRR